jgi:hypothetical protein
MHHVGGRFVGGLVSVDWGVVSEIDEVIAFFVSCRAAELAGRDWPRMPAHLRGPERAGRVIPFAAQRERSTARHLSTARPDAAAQ